MCEKDSNRRRSWGRAIARRIWGALPIVMLLVIFAVLSHLISAKTDRLSALKQGTTTLEAKRMAIDNRDRAIAVIGAASDSLAAVDALMAEFSITEEQAKAIALMAVGEMTAAQMKKLDSQIAYIKEQIARNNLELTPDRPDVNVVVMELYPRSISDRINLPGIVEPWVGYNVIARVPGEVLEKRIDKGAKVRAGDVLAVLDPRDYEIARDAARAAYENARLTKQRLDSLFKKKMVPRSQLDDISAQVERYKADFDSAELNLERCTICSPIAGIVNNVFIEEGQYANAGDPVVEVMQLDRVKVVVGIPESDVSEVRRVSEFAVSFDALGGKVFSARKHFLSVAGDPAARLYNLELVIDNPDREILPDMFARVDIVKSAFLESLSVPLYSIMTLDNEQTVYVVNDEKAHARKIRLGIQEGWRVQVTEGLMPGDRLIVVGHRRVSDGQTVNVIKTVSAMEEI